MKDELELALVRDFAPMFDMYHQDMMQSSMCWGFECDDGWEPLIRSLCEQIKLAGVDSTFRVSQVKEKYGGLRFYTFGNGDEIDKLIDEAERRSYLTCEHCGTTESVETKGGWIKTLCKECRSETR